MVFPGTVHSLYISFIKMSRMNLKEWRNSIVLTIASLVLSGCLFGCNNQTYEDEPIIIVDRKVDELTYNLDEATVGDVTLTKNVNVEYVQTKEQQVAFNVGGKVVDKVYVREGDRVKKGDLLVELKTDNLEEQILDMKYKIKQSELSLSFLDKQEEFDKESAHITLIHTRLTGDDYCDYEDSINKIERNYRYQREDISDSILFDKEKLAKLESELTSKRIYADMAGTIISVKEHLEGSTAKRGDVIMTVVDNSNGLFSTKDETLKDVLNEGDLLNMSIVYGNAKGEYVLTPYEMNSWGEQQLFSVVEAPEGGGLEVGTSGTIRIDIEKKEKILRIPVTALYEADERYYTYILDEDNMRSVRFIDIGLIGDNYVEVISGIKAGDKVIKK